VRCLRLGFGLRMLPALAHVRADRALGRL
jgi:hypothetical protein